MTTQERKARNLDIGRCYAHVSYMTQSKRRGIRLAAYCSGLSESSVYAIVRRVQDECQHDLWNPFGNDYTVCRTCGYEPVSELTDGSKN